ncbi:hypothetical protein LAh9_49 [Aeromonas phage LAh_9]|uniref:Uncharacterized protein n=1 Tax=Aeromonas phage LAh_9 TaxID=2591033 RepID=A0A514A0X7_9CAUD|nr:hypothetical protein HWC32_gp049 [Aeromonas phage LAh_9]QDH46927.1 hypothetical protein LAh9_49 [Aeromonas phage LAh_9]
MSLSLPKGEVIMAKAPTRVQQVLDLKKAIEFANEQVQIAQQSINQKQSSIREIQDEILEEYKAAGGVVPDSSPRYGSIKLKQNLRPGDLIISKGNMWNSDIIGRIVTFKELCDDGHIRAIIRDGTSSATDYGSDFIFVARPIK